MILLPVSVALSETAPVNVFEEYRREGQLFGVLLGEREKTTVVQQAELQKGQEFRGAEVESSF
jgi:hypothetical protein